jgi:hypothetical protein
MAACTGRWHARQWAQTAHQRASPCAISLPLPLTTTRTPTRRWSFSCPTKPDQGPSGPVRVAKAHAVLWPYAHAVWGACSGATGTARGSYAQDGGARAAAAGGRRGRRRRAAVHAATRPGPRGRALWCRHARGGTPPQETAAHRVARSSVQSPPPPPPPPYPIHQHAHMDRRAKRQRERETHADARTHARDGGGLSGC